MSWTKVIRILLKAALLFVLINAAFALVYPVETLGRFSVYNTLVPGRVRLPYGENPAQSNNLSLYSVQAMFASHAISRPKPADEYRVVLIGDSATWGWLLEPDQTIAAQINTANATTDDGRRIVAYNLAYPIMSLTKDLMLLEEAMHYQPDLIIWLVTLESFPMSKQLFPPIVQNNADRVRDLITDYDLPLDADADELVDRSWWDRTIIGARRPLADWLRLQAYGFAWSATGIDQFIPADYPLTARDLEDDITWDLYDAPTDFTDADLAFDALAAGIEMAESANVPLLIVNEPMFISDGANRDIRYNAFYPRWAYDQYREQLTAFASDNRLPFVDAWDAVPPVEFTDSPVHLTPAGVEQLSEVVLPEIEALAE